ncbi:ankyrin repeat and SAM domain-containing protein 3-like isoform X1 [Venturia canescens]|uniref:ankyrin repeat and SAM domain-containing protein 3-like isoform X1 n=1 Tax=Venturia canescens TaxID=32260 RepID=UPI001C9C039D|nr:ankyrin repeat and SAM domain-containing protein 3-like isoform X1 [Venturia canescens]XP_043278083.1 ankyrin repeat and SAM domain-containing protein 3-like isoform X1 [Venturia canescens]
MSSFTDNFQGDSVESEIIDVMRKSHYSLDTVNNYGDDLLHVTAANGCYFVIKEILKKHDDCDIDKRNDNGWSPLMLAIRNGNVESVKLLLDNGCNPEQSTYQGVSAIALSVAISREMFEIVYEACPSALEKAKTDKINPLCVAAMKNDKELFFRLIELGLTVSQTGDYTLLMIAHSNVPEIANFGESFNNDSLDYWNEHITVEDLESFTDEHFDVPQMSSTLQNGENSLEYQDEEPIENRDVPEINVDPPQDTNSNSPKINSDKGKLSADNNNNKSKGLISPRLQYTRERTLAMSPNLCLARRRSGNDSGFGMEFRIQRDQMDRNHNRETHKTDDRNARDGNKLHKFQMNRPPNLQIAKTENDQTSNKTPVEPRCSTPPREMALNDHQTKMARLLKCFGLTQFIPIFLEQEVDLGLFLSLTDQDLKEIGIEKRSHLFWDRISK